MLDIFLNNINLYQIPNPDNPPRLTASSNKVLDTELEVTLAVYLIVFQKQHQGGLTLLLIIGPEARGLIPKAKSQKELQWGQEIEFQPGLC